MSGLGFDSALFAVIPAKAGIHPSDPIAPQQAATHQSLVSGSSSNDGRPLVGQATLPHPSPDLPSTGWRTPGNATRHDPRRIARPAHAARACGMR